MTSVFDSFFGIGWMFVGFVFALNADLDRFLACFAVGVVYIKTSEIKKLVKDGE